MTTTPTIFELYQKTNGFEPLPKSRAQQTITRVNDMLPDRLKVKMPVYKNKTDDGTRIKVYRTDDGTFPDDHSYKMLVWNKRKCIAKQTLERERSEDGVKIEVSYYKNDEVEKPYKIDGYDGKFNLLWNDWHQEGGAKEDRQVNYKGNDYNEAVPVLDTLYYPKVKLGEEGIKKQITQYDLEGNRTVQTDIFPNGGFKRIAEFYPNSDEEKEVEEYIAYEYKGKEEMKKYAAPYNPQRLPKEYIRHVSTYSATGSIETLKEYNIKGNLHAFTQFDENGKPERKQSFYPDGGVKSDIHYEDGVISSRKVYHKKKNEPDGEGAFVNDGGETVSTERDQVYQGDYVNFESQVGEFVDELFLALNKDDKKKGAKKEDAFNAIKGVLKTNFNDMNCEQFFGNKAATKELLTDKIKNKYQELEAFLLAVQHEDLKLPDDNPLKTYKSGNHGIGKKYRETIVTPNATITSAFETSANNLVSNEVGSRLRTKTVEHARASKDKWLWEEELHFHPKLKEPATDPAIIDPRLKVKYQQVASQTLMQNHESVVTHFYDKKGQMKDTTLEENREIPWRNYADRQKARLVFSKREFPDVSQTMLTDVNVSRGDPDGKTPGAISITLQGRNADIKNAHDRLKMKKTLEIRALDMNPNSLRQPILHDALLCMESITGQPGNGAGTDGNVSVLHITIPYRETKIYMSELPDARAAADLLRIVHRYTKCDLGLSVTPAPKPNQHWWGPSTPYADIAMRQNNDNKIMKSTIMYIAREQINKLSGKKMHIDYRHTPGTVLVRVEGEEISDKGLSKNKMKEAWRQSIIMAEDIAHVLDIPDQQVAQQSQAHR